MNTHVNAPIGQNFDAAANRRDFLYIATATAAAAGGIFAVWPLLDNMNPSADVRALAKIEVDLQPIEIGQRVTVKWRGSPLFIVRRSAKQIAAAKADDNNIALIDPATDASRVKREEWLIVIGVCTHLGCIPQGQRDGDLRGDWGGWFCACHGSVYDIAGRVRRGPAPENLWLPPYEFNEKDGVVVG